MEGLEVDAAEGDDHPTWLAAQGCDAGAHALKEDALLVVFQPPRVKALVILVLLAGQLALSEGMQVMCTPADHRWHKRLASQCRGCWYTQRHCLWLPVLLGRALGCVQGEPGEMQLSVPAAACHRSLSHWSLKVNRASLRCVFKAANACSPQHARCQGLCNATVGLLVLST